MFEITRVRIIEKGTKNKENHLTHAKNVLFSARCGYNSQDKLWCKYSVARLSDLNAYIASTK